MVEVWDIRFGSIFYLRVAKNIEQLKIRILSSEVDGIQGGPPCSTWSVVRALPGGPPPVRSRLEPWGLSTLKPFTRKHVDNHSGLLKGFWELAEAAAQANATEIGEHPADPLGDHPSSWHTDFVQEKERSAGNSRWHVDQCYWGASSRKASILSTNAHSEITSEFFGRAKCPGISPGHQHRILRGVGPDGNWLTTKAQEYPPKMCEALAEVMVRDALRRRQATTEMEDIVISPIQEVQFRKEELTRRRDEKLTKLAPPIHERWVTKERWKLAYQIEWRYESHNNVTETSMAVAAVRRLGRSFKHWGKRVLVFVDNMTAIGALTKGRSCSAPILRQCRKLASISLGLGIIPCFRYVATDRNMADGPSRGYPVGVAPKTPGKAAPARLFEEASPYGKHWWGFG